MSDSWGSGTAHQPPPAGYRPQSAPRAPKRSSSAAFRDTSIVAVLGVAGMVAMLVWSGGDVPSGAADPGTELTLPPDFTLPPGFTLPDTGELGGTTVTTAASSDAQVLAGEAFIATLPVPAGATEVPSGTLRGRRWMFAGTTWEAVRDDYLTVLRGQGFAAELAQSVSQPGVTGEVYTVTDPSGTIRFSVTVGESAGNVALDVTA